VVKKYHEFYFHSYRI